MENYRVVAALTFDSKLTHRVLETHTLYLFPWKLLREFVTNGFMCLTVAS